MRGLPHVLPYLDDILIFSKTYDEHLLNVARVLEAHRKANIKIEPRKTQLFCKRVAYLGSLIAEDGICPLSANVESILGWPCPTTKLQARTFAAKINYYRHHIKDLAKVARPLLEVQTYELLDNATFVHSSELRRCVETLQNC